MAKTRTDKQEEKLIKELRVSVLQNFGKKCDDHPEECAICEIHKALETFERLYGKE